VESLTPIADTGGPLVRRARVRLQRAVGSVRQPATGRSVEVKVPRLAAPRRGEAAGSGEAASDVGSLHAFGAPRRRGGLVVVEFDQDRTTVV
jgi:hypothetical protein